MRINITVSDELKAWIEDRAKRLGISQSAIVVNALEEWISQKESSKPTTDINELISKIDKMQEEIKELRK